MSTARERLRAAARQPPRVARRGSTQLFALRRGGPVDAARSEVRTQQNSAAANVPFLSLISTLTERCNENGASESSGLTFPPFPRTIGIVLRRCASSSALPSTLAPAPILVRRVDNTERKRREGSAPLDSRARPGEPPIDVTAPCARESFFFFFSFFSFVIIAPPSTRQSAGLASWESLTREYFLLYMNGNEHEVEAAEGLPGSRMTAPRTRSLRCGTVRGRERATP